MSKVEKMSAASNIFVYIEGSFVGYSLNYLWLP
eukprot:SAG31_NODE_20193_length_581_cov_1.122407_1_plen_32_part_10